MSENQIVIENLSKTYDNGFSALKKVNLNIKKVKFLQCLDQTEQAKHL
jgi:ABC-type Fe3+/spermidine/putrescine transport system ATPase subunit